MNGDAFLNVCQKYALSKSGKCLSSKYILVHEKLLWECEFGHKWEASPANIKRGKWCPTCSKNKKLSLGDCIDYAKSRDGYCLSTEYTNSASVLVWQCKFGHTWKSNFNNVKSKRSWCPICRTNVGESISRLFFEQFFGKLFPKIRPKWLVTEQGSKLELDGYSSEINIAFEYQGLQHYKIDGFFIKTAEQLNKRKSDDLLKQKLCLEHGVKLIVIPYFQSLINIQAIISVLSDLLSQHGFTTYNIISIDLNKLNMDKIQKYKELAKNRGGECLSDVYIDYYTKLIWRCNYGHVWDAVGYSIEKGHWCPDCAGNRKGNRY